jgi:predicted TIM-barrel fold metal-dependent hydrolase
MTAPTRFNDHYDLARLDQFEIRDGHRLVLAEPERWKSFDAHTHLALAYVLPMRVDLHREHPVTEHYLSLGSPLDLDIYANKNFTPSSLKAMTRDLTLMSVTGAGMRRTHTVPNVLREMKELGIAGSLLLPIDLPVLSDNAGAYLRATAGVDEIVCFGSVHPHARNVAKKLDQQKAAGARGIKVHPAVQLLRPDHPKAMQLYRLCAERELPVLWHCGPVGIEPEAGRRRCQVRYYERPIAEIPDCTFILGHSGALQGELAIEFAQKYPNAYLETASQSLVGVRAILERAPHERIMAGSDWPFYHQAMHLAKLFIAAEDDEELLHKVLWDNAACLFDLPAR